MLNNSVGHVGCKGLKTVLFTNSCNKLNGIIDLYVESF